MSCSLYYPVVFSLVSSLAKDDNNISNTVRYGLGEHSRPKRPNRLSNIAQYEYSAICKRNYWFF